MPRPNSRRLASALLFSATALLLPVSAGQAEELLSQLLDPTADPVVESRPLKSLPPAGVSVYDRPRPAFEALGVRTGTFLFYPSLEIEEEFNDNIFGTTTNTKSDLTTKFRPNLRFDSDWNNHQLSLGVGLEAGFYKEHTAEDYTDYNLFTSGRLDVVRDTEITGRLDHNRKHQDRSSDDDVGGTAVPTTFTESRARIGFARDVAIVSLSMDAETKLTDFDDTRNTDNSLTNNDDRDRQDYLFSARVGYEWTENNELFSRMNLERRDYDDSEEDGGPNRNNDGYGLVVGTTFDFGGRTTGEVFGGYSGFDYADDRLSDVGEIMFGASVLWVGDLWTFEGTIDRSSIDETTVVDVDQDDVAKDASAVLNTRYTFRSELEAYRFFLLNAELGYSHSEFLGTTREDDSYEVSFGADYYFNSHVNLSGGYTYKNKDGGAQNTDFAQNIFRISGRAQF